MWGDMDLNPDDKAYKRRLWFDLTTWVILPTILVGLLIALEVLR